LKTGDSIADSTYLSSHTAISTVKLRKVANGQYVREISLVDFSNTKVLPQTLGSSNYTYVDNGQGYDTEGKDGVYTSTVFISSPDTTHLFENLSARGDTLYVFAGSQFSHASEAANYGEDLIGGSVSIGCKIGFIKCSEGGTCNACLLYNATCFYFYDCEVTISLTW
jgi:hypothetical protein